MEVKSYGGNCADGCEDLILVGNCFDSVYYANLTFPPVFIEPDEVLKKASLKLYCKRSCGEQSILKICANDDSECLNVYREGGYEWNVTRFIENDFGPPRFCLYSRYEWSRTCGLKEFEAVAPGESPVLELEIDDEYPCPQHGVVNIVKKYSATDQIHHSAWINCMNMNGYYYFIQNLGTGAVKVSTEISPDKSMTVVDAGPFVINPNETYHLDPLRRSGFIRILFQNESGSSTNPIQVWYQGTCDPL